MQCKIKFKLCTRDMNTHKNYKMKNDYTLFSYKLDTNFKKYNVRSMIYSIDSIEWE